MGASFLRGLSRRLPVLRELNLIKEQMKRLSEAVGSLAVQQAASRPADRPIFRSHLERFAGGHPVQEEEISYPFRFMARTLEPVIEDHDPGKIALCTVAVGNAYRRQVRRCLESQRAYCTRHGHAHAELSIPPDSLTRPLPWYKIPLVHHLFGLGYEKVLYIDADAAVTNPEVPLRGFFDRLEASRRAMLIAEDEGGVNTGVFFMRRCPAALRLLDLIWLQDDAVANPTWEQFAFRELLTAYPVLHSAVEIAPRAKDFNSFPHERTHLLRHSMRPRNTWSPGDFVCHFSGVRAPQLGRLIEAYLNEHHLPAPPFP